MYVVVVLGVAVVGSFESVSIAAAAAAVVYVAVGVVAVPARWQPSALNTTFSTKYKKQTHTMY